MTKLNPFSPRKEEAIRLALRPAAAARSIGVSVRTLQRWTDDGLIRCSRIGAGRKPAVLYRIADLERLLDRDGEDSPQSERDA